MSAPRVLAVGGPSFRQQVAIALGIAPESVNWVPALATAEKYLVETEGQTELLALSPEIPEPDALLVAEFTSRTSPATAVVLVRSQAPNGSLAEFVRSGVRDVVDLSHGQDELADALQRAFAWSTSLRSHQSEEAANRTSQLGKLITVFSSKGGSGKTFLACNLAAALADRSGRDTALIDLDFGMGDVFSYYGAEPRRPLEDLFAPGGLANREVILAASTHLQDNLWAFGSPPDPAAEPIPAQGVGKILRGLQMNFDYIVVDGPTDYSDQMLAAFDASDRIYLLASLDVVGVRHLSASIETLTSIGVPRDRLSLVLNRADSKVGLDVSDVEKVMGVKIDSLIPSSRLVPTSLNKGHPVYNDEPRSDVAQSVGRLADTIIKELPGRSPAGDVLPQEHRKRRLFARN
ncbi:MAG: AAA family ATPase [Actinomycetota bacterium]